MFYNLADLIITPSVWTKKTLLNRGVKIPTRVLSNGIDFERFNFNEERRKRFREKYNISNGDKVVYQVGVMCVKKGIETVAPVARANPDVGLLAGQAVRTGRGGGGSVVDRPRGSGRHQHGVRSLIVLQAA